MAKVVVKVIMWFVIFIILTTLYLLGRIRNSIYINKLKGIISRNDKRRSE